MPTISGPWGRSGGAFTANRGQIGYRSHIRSAVAVMALRVFGTEMAPAGQEISGGSNVLASVPRYQAGDHEPPVPPPVDRSAPHLSRQTCQRLIRTDGGRRNTPDSPTASPP